MLEALARHPNAHAVLAPALNPQGPGAPSHAYLFHGPAGAGKRELAREIAAVLLAQGAPDQASAHARALAGSHPDLTWVTPSGAHEMLVSDIDEPVVAAASKTPFESSRRVFVIESAEQLTDQAANRMLKTLEEPPAFVHIILITDRLAEVLPTIRSRCQAVRFEAPTAEQLSAELVQAGVGAATADAYVRLSLGDPSRARELATAEGAVLRDRAQQLVHGALAGESGASAPAGPLLEAVRARGERTRAELEERAAVEIALYPKKEQKRVENEWSDRVKRIRRRVETGALALALDLAEAWLLDLAALAWGASDLVRNSDRLPQLQADAELGRGADARALRRAVELVEDTRIRFPLNVSEDLACEALTYRLERVLAG
jgi:DNA polymerase-3 subunit delta'